MSAALKYAKPRPRALDKKDRLAALKKLDAAESKKVRVRSGGRCEVVTCWAGSSLVHCDGRASQVHHLYGGNGQRGRGKSALSLHKQYVCINCHAAIGAGILKRIGGQERLWSDVYERQR